MVHSDIPHISPKLVELIGQALKAVTDWSNSKTAALVRAYELPTIIPGPSGHEYPPAYFDRVVMEASTDEERQSNALLIAAALVQDFASNNPVLDRERSRDDVYFESKHVLLAFKKFWDQLDVEQITPQLLVANREKNKRFAVLRSLQPFGSRGSSAPVLNASISNPRPSEPARWGDLVVFLIHGHDEAKRRELQDILEKQLKLRVVVMKEEPGKSRTFMEKLEESAAPCTAAIAVLTPDDVVRDGEEAYSQARPNVVFELGWFSGKLGRDHTLLVVREGTTVPSDLFGIEQLRFQRNIDEVFLNLQKEVEEWRSPAV